MVTHLTGSSKAMLIPISHASRAVSYTHLDGYKRQVLPSMEEICRDTRRIVVIDGVVDTTKIGAIFRSAAALGIDAVLLTRNSCDPWNRRAVSVSMGSVFLVPWTWLDGTMGDLNKLGFRTAAMALTDDSISIDHPILAAEPRLAIVMGTEGEGDVYKRQVKGNILFSSSSSFKILSISSGEKLNIRLISRISC